MPENACWEIYLQEFEEPQFLMLAVVPCSMQGSEGHNTKGSWEEQSVGRIADGTSKEGREEGRKEGPSVILPLACRTPSLSLSLARAIVLSLALAPYPVRGGAEAPLENCTAIMRYIYGMCALSFSLATWTPLSRLGPLSVYNISGKKSCRAIKWEAPGQGGISSISGLNAIAAPSTT